MTHTHKVQNNRFVYVYDVSDHTNASTTPLQLIDADH